MSSIYLAASVVSIWLGPSQDGSDVVVKVMVAAQDGATFTFRADDAIHEFVSWRPAKDGASLKSGADNVDDEFVSWSLKTPRDDFIDVEHPVEASMLRYMRALLARPYWGSLWILQEVSLGIRVEVLCGGYAVDWNTFAGALTTARIALPDSFSRLESIMSLRQNVSTISRHCSSRPSAIPIHQRPRYQETRCTAFSVLLWMGHAYSLPQVMARSR
jgi:hypothetical protein